MKTFRDLITSPVHLAIALMIILVVVIGSLYVRNTPHVCQQVLAGYDYVISDGEIKRVVEKYKSCCPQGK